MQTQQRLNPIMGDNPTAASVARYKQRLNNVFTAPHRLTTDDDETYSVRYAEAMKKAQASIRPPSLPIIGHGQQLAARRMAKLATSIDQPLFESRQVERRKALKAARAEASRQKRQTIKDRRNKKKATAA